MQSAKTTQRSAARAPSTDPAIDSTQSSAEPRRARAPWRRLLALAALSATALASWVAIAQMPNAYGPPIGIDAAKRAAALAIA
jgi:hypothetical protein